MELNWTTFLLEIINFLVLVWLLQRFFYQPLKDVIERRREGIEKQLQEAREMQHQAELQRTQYENRLNDWETERQDARAQLQKEIAEERRQLLAELQQSLAAERKKSEVLAARPAEEQQRQFEARALALAAHFASKLLGEFATLETQAKLLEHLMRELQQLEPAQREKILTNMDNGKPMSVHVLSAYPLDQNQQKTLGQYLDKLLSSALHYDFDCDRKLLAGVRITVGPWVIHANLADELKTFVDIAHEK